MSNRVREIFYPLLVCSIIGSLWIVGWTQEMEEELRSGTPPSPRWAALERIARINAH